MTETEQERLDSLVDRPSGKTLALLGTFLANVRSNSRSYYL